MTSLRVQPRMFNIEETIFIYSFCIGLVTLLLTQLLFARITKRICELSIDIIRVFNSKFVNFVLEAEMMETFDLNNFRRPDDLVTVFSYQDRI